MIKNMLQMNVAVLLMILSSGAAASNMNGKPGQYKIANAHQYVTDYQHEYFQVYSLLSSRLATLGGLLEDSGPGVSPHGYSEKRFANKIIAITGCIMK
jgi:hypothetical protein